MVSGYEPLTVSGEPAWSEMRSRKFISLRQLKILARFFGEEFSVMIALQGLIMSRALTKTCKASVAESVCQTVRDCIVMPTYTSMLGIQ